MSRGFRSADVAMYALDGMAVAAKKWSDLHGTTANNAPEYWFTVHVALQLQKKLENEKCWIGLEASVYETLAQSQGIKKGRPRNSTRINGRVDIVVARANEKPAVAIEVKSPVWNFNKLKADVIRLRDLIIAKPNKLTLGCLAIMTTYPEEGSRKGAKATIDGLFKRFRMRASEECSETGLFVLENHYLKKDTESSGWWGVQCITLSRSRLWTK